AVLIMGGADRAVEQDLLDQPLDLGATVLLAGDHGAEGTCATGWLAQVRPACAVISVGTGNIRGQPDREMLARLRAQSIPTWRTDENGPIRIAFLPSTPGGKKSACRPLVSLEPPAPAESPQKPDRSEAD
ncbi:MAG: hypothetical protein KJ726_02920, partial [Verrucomicrobia bacterium]|nr:hypothetical protein [Verrucomicrobiota bacterium]